MAHKRIGHNAALLLARAVGFAAASTAIGLWCWLLIDGTINGGITGGTYVVGGIIIALALLAAWGALALKLWALVLAFAASFFPVGFYFLGAPSVFALVGVANMLYLFVGLFISFTQYRMRRR